MEIEHNTLIVRFANFINDINICILVPSTRVLAPQTESNSICLMGNYERI